MHLPVRVRQFNSTHFQETLTKDLGLGGLRYISATPVPVLTECTLELMLASGKEPLQLRGRAVWFQTIPHSDQFEVGVAFFEVPEETKRRLSTYLQRISTSAV